MDLGTHTLFLADVTDGEVLDGVALGHLRILPLQHQARPCKGAEDRRGDARSAATSTRERSCPADFTCPVCKHGAADFEKI